VTAFAASHEVGQPTYGTEMTTMMDRSHQETNGTLKVANEVLEVVATRSR